MNNIVIKLLGRSVIVLLVVIVIIGVGAMVFLRLEDWTTVEALYFATVTLTTVGYGDITPSNEMSRIATMIYSLFTVPLFFLMIGLLAEVIFYKYLNKTIKAHKAIHTKRSTKKSKKSKK